MIDAELLATSLRGLPLERLPSDRDAEQAVQLLFAEALAGNSERISVSLIAPDGRVLIHAGEEGAPDKETAKAAMAVATDHDQPSVSNHGRITQHRVRHRAGGDPVQLLLALCRPDLGPQKPQAHLDQSMVQVRQHDIISPGSSMP